MLALNRKTILICAIVLACLFICTVEQRGGSRSKSSSSSRSSSWSSSRRPGSYYSHSHSTRTPKNCTTVNGTTTCTYDESSGELSWPFIIIIVIVVGGICLVGMRQNKLQNEKRQEIIHNVMNDFEARMEEWPSTYDMPTRQKMIDAFMSRSYTMVINVKDQAEKFYCQVKVTDLNRVNENKFEIKMTGSDEVGTSKLEGLLIYRADGLGIKLSKVYDDRQKAEQTGSFDVLLYEGVGDPNRFGGEWAFHGHESSLQYSGYWFMAQI